MGKYSPFYMDFLGRSPEIDFILHGRWNKTRDILSFSLTVMLAI
jgi:hypothetical protein